MRSLLFAFVVFVVCSTLQLKFPFNSFLYLFDFCGVEASPIAQTKLKLKCSQGQEYWCQSITIAKSCNAVEHCNQMVWNVRQTKFDNDKKQYPETECGADCNPSEDIVLTKPIGHIGIIQLMRDNEFIPQIDSIDTEMVDIPCALCTELFTNVKKSINKTSKAEFKNILKGLCKNVQVGKTECLDWFDKHSDEIYNILNKLEPESACLQIGLCPKKMQQSIDSDEEIAIGYWNEYQSEFDDELFEINAVPLNQDNDSENGLSSIECSLCEKVMDKVQKEIGRDKSREHIKDALSHACHIVHEKKFRKKCEKFIEKDGDKIIDAIIKGEASKLICSAIGLCLAEKQEQNEIQMSPMECLECQHILKGVEAKVGNDRSKEHVEAVLQEQCGSITNDDLKKKCFAFVQDHNDYIVNALMNNQPPKQICKSLKFCASSPTEQIVSQMMKKYSDTPQCVVCQMIAVNLDDLLRENSTIEQIDHAIHTVCKYVPKKYSAKCEDFVENYAELAISYLLSASPKELCLGLNFCRADVKKDTSHRDILECGVCSAVVDALATVYSHDGSKEMDVVSETTCNLIPLKHQKECIELMDVYGVSLSILLNRSEKQSEVCEKIGKCFVDGDDRVFHEIKEAFSNTENDVNSDQFNGEDEINQSSDLNEASRLLGAKGCTLGPSYWCSSKKTMEECNAHVFCKEYAVLFLF
ncbi:prosaposin-like isoform X3 [Sitodiplosis mosellana]|uniref:prosaposin-like isoform X3 n=1 Tax=Sitodiplosis mosellana TaxID=263140 RepID=UPI0024443807|nr:prosaposin-like isoform X3 [Sitodiplosis mosellana]